MNLRASFAFSLLALTAACTASSTDATAPAADEALTAATSKDMGPLVIARTSATSGAIAHAFSFQVKDRTDTSDVTCFDTNEDTTFGQASFPAAGERIVFTNASSEPVYLRAFTDEDTGHGDQRNQNPSFGAGLDVVGTGVIPDNLAGTVVELAPGESVAAIAPTLPSPAKMWSEVRFSCQRVSTFAARPKFSYGWQYGFLAATN